ncbi:cupredoxin domain-containing protein [Streptomyces longwoodensis]|uniref:cupredoxin domain-containing protein n=1 Tax=Streptomyces longwoodensis TaxID=68231 RepID=UPI0036EFA5CB
MSPAARRRRTVPLALTAIAALSFATACSNTGGGSKPSTSSPAAPSSVSITESTLGAAQITMRNFAFSPATLTVKAGEKVTVVNEDGATHTVTASQGGAFDTGSIAGGKSGTFTAPSKAGTYAFVCTFHPNMKGTLTVR